MASLPPLFPHLSTLSPRLRVAGGAVVAVLAIPAWPLVLAAGYIYTVTATMVSSPLRNGLLAAMIVPALLAQGAWGSWLGGRLGGGAAPAPATVLSERTADTSPPASGLTDGRVLQVQDAANIDVEVLGQAYHVVLLGIQAQTAATADRPAQCFAAESTTFLTTLTVGKVVQLQADPEAGDRSESGALLRYMLVDGKSVNQTLIDSGYAREGGAAVAYRARDIFQQSQGVAESGRAGLWGSCPEFAPVPTVAPTVSPVAKKPVATVKKSTVKATPAPTAVIVPTPSPTPVPMVTPMIPPDYTPTEPTPTSTDTP